jgi:hypothetical protein
LLSKEPRAQIVEVLAHGDMYRITITLESDLSRPLAPASLCSDSDPSITLAELYRLVEINENTATFESSDDAQIVFNDGDVVRFRRWWTSDQLKIAQDTKRHWQLSVINTQLPNWTHEHCALCWTTLGEGENLSGFTDDLGNDWLCERCYEKYIASGLGTRLGDIV